MLYLKFIKALTTGFYSFLGRTTFEQYSLKKPLNLSSIQMISYSHLFTIMKAKHISSAVYNLRKLIELIDKKTT